MAKPKTPREVLLMLFRRKTLFLLAAAFFAIVVLWGSHWAPLKYTAEAKFERTNDASSIGRETGSGTYSELKPLLYVRLAGPMVLADALKKDEIGLTKNFPRNADGTLTAEGQAKLDQLVRSVSPNLRVRMDTSTDLVDVVTIEFTHSDPDVAEQLPTTLFNMYKEFTVNELHERLDVSMSSTRKELAVENTKLKDASMRKTRFEIEHKDMMPQSPTGLQDLMIQQNKELDKVERLLKDEENNLEWFQQLGLGGLRSGGSADGDASSEEDEVQEYSLIPNPKLETLRDEIKLYEDRLENAKVAGMKPNHPDYQRVERMISELQKKIESEPEKIREREIIRPKNKQTIGAQEVQVAVIKRRIESLKREQADMIEEIARTSKKLDNFLKVRQDYLTLCADEARCRESVDRLDKQLSSVEANFKAEVAKRRTMLRMVQPPQKQYLPSSPKLSMILIMALAGGLGVGGVLVFLANSVDRTIGTTDEAMRYFDLTLHGAVGEIDTPADRSWRFVKRWVITPIVIVIVLIVIGVSCMDVVLRLKYPQRYIQWQKEPVTFVMEELGEIFASLKH